MTILCRPIPNSGTGAMRAHKGMAMAKSIDFEVGLDQFLVLSDLRLYINFSVPQLPISEGRIKLPTFRSYG